MSPVSVEAVSDYREYPPPPALAERLVCLWTQTITRSQRDFVQWVFPDACLDIVIVNEEAPTVIGPWTQPFAARLSPGTRIVGARFQPGHAPGLLGLPASILLNQSVPLASTSGRAAAPLFEQVLEGRTLATRLSAMEAALLAHAAHANSVDGVTSAAILWLCRNPHHSVAQLSRWTGFSTRQLHRRFTAAVGYGPKMFQSVLRFQRLLYLAGRTEQRSLADLSADAGFADQAHMTREVRRFSGGPPTALFKSSRSALQLSNLLHVYCAASH
jgi:AraC-like DNA-binding protein